MHIILSQKGSKISLKQGAFVIRNKEGVHTFSPEKIKSITLTEGITLSSNVVLFAIEHEVDLLWVNEEGQPQGRIWSHKFGSISSLRRKQVDFAERLEAGKWLLSLMEQQAKARIALLAKLAKKQGKTESEVIFKLKKQLETLNLISPQIPDKVFLSRLRSWEAQHARMYFACLAAEMPGGFQFRKRSRRPARDYFNSALNYLYGMLYAKVELVLLQAGLDPYLGLMHRDQYNRPALVYDQMELYRPWAEEVLAELCLEERLHPSSFSKRKRGIWLNEQGKKELIPAMHSFLASPKHPQGSVSREALMLSDAHQLARWVES